MLTEKAIAALEQVKKDITEEPRRFNMMTWIGNASDRSEEHRPPCNTTACIAGHVVLNAQKITTDTLKATRNPFDAFEPKCGWQCGAQRILGIDNGAGDRLFHWEQ